MNRECYDQFHSRLIFSRIHPLVLGSLGSLLVSFLGPLSFLSLTLPPSSQGLVQSASHVQSTIFFLCCRLFQMSLDVPSLTSTIETFSSTTKKRICTLGSSDCSHMWNALILLFLTSAHL